MGAVAAGAGLAAYDFATGRPAQGALTVVPVVYFVLIILVTELRRQGPRR